MDKILKDIKPVHLYIVGITLSFLAIIISILRIGELYSTLSDFGADYRTDLVFNFIIFLSGIISVIGCVLLCKENFKKYGRIRSFSLITATASLSFIGLFPLGINQNVIGIHHIFTTTFFIGMPICMILFSTLFYKSNQTIFLVLSILGVLDFVQIIIFYNNKQIQVWQWLGILSILVFNFILLRYSNTLVEIKDELEELG